MENRSSQKRGAGFIKIVAEEESGVIVGAQMMCWESDRHDR